MTTSEKMWHVIVDYYKDKYNNIKIRGIIGNNDNYYIYNAKYNMLEFYIYKHTEYHKSVKEKYQQIIRIRNIKDILE